MAHTEKHQDEEQSDPIAEWDKSEKEVLSDDEIIASARRERMRIWDDDPIDSSPPTVILETEDEADSPFSPRFQASPVLVDSSEPAPTEFPVETMAAPGVDVEQTVGGFRVQSKAYLLTYKTHLDKEGIETFLTQTGGHRTLAKFLAAHETGDKTCPYEHTHILVVFTKPLSSRNCRIFDFDSIHPNIKALRGSKAVKDAEQYLCKEDPANANILLKPTLIDTIINARTPLDACRLVAEKPSDIGGVIQGWNLREPQLQLPDPINPENREWQKEILEKVSERAHPRHIHWLFDEIGNTGKSSFSNFLEDEEDEKGFTKWFALADVSNSKEVAHQVLSAVQRGWSGWGVIIDLSRSFEHSSAIYTVLEGLKNGRMTSVKYQGGRIKMASPHVIVLANWWPDITRLSQDRWLIHEITQDYKLVRRDNNDRPVNESKHCRTCSCNSNYESRAMNIAGCQK